MKKAISFALITLLLYSCAAYKQLKPEPEINPQENGFIEIKKDSKNFKLKKDKKYYMIFPAATAPDDYLVLDIANKDLFNSYLTETFDQGKGRIIEIKDESPEPDHLSVYPVSNNVPRYYWVIDLVKQDLVLNMQYRYVARWRFKFERRYNAFKKLLEENSVERTPYESLGINVQPADLNPAQEIEQITAKNKNLLKLKAELKQIEDIFPANIRNTKDESYQNFVQLKNQLQDELSFQDKYLQVLKLIKEDRESRNNMEKFFTALPDFLQFFKSKDQFPDNVIITIRDLLKKRLQQVVPYYEQKLKAKNDAKRIDSAIPQLEELYPAAGLVMSEDFKKLGAFVFAYNKIVDDVWKVKKELKTIQEKVRQQKNMPSNSFFSDIVTRLSKMLYAMPKASNPAFQPYRNYQCVKQLAKEIKRVQNSINTLLSKYRRADALVPEINVLKERNDLHGILSLLKKNKDLDFLLPLYSKLDEESLNKQATAIQNALQSENWALADEALKNLYNDRDFINYGKIKPQKIKLAKKLEKALIDAITQKSKQRAKQFILENLNTLQNVESLYENPAFQPVYQPSFFVPGTNAQAQMQALNEALTALKTLTFPKSAIENLYKQLIANPDNQGVAKARAIVVHGKHYRGDDATVKNRVAECDPKIPKLLTKPRSYRRIFALPVTSNAQGANTYLFKVNLKIPSPAQFPVFDVYIRLPKNLAQKAGSKQWYESITFNGKIIKNEGRYMITAPGPENNYECQVGPLQIVKTSNNILTVRFKKAGLKVYQVSVMAQKPIIKKH